MEMETEMEMEVERISIALTCTTMFTNKMHGSDFSLHSV